MKKINPNSFFTFNGKWLKRSGAFRTYGVLTTVECQSISSLKL